MEESGEDHCWIVIIDCFDACKRYVVERCLEICCVLVVSPRFATHHHRHEFSFLVEFFFAVVRSASSSRSPLHH